MDIVDHNEIALHRWNCGASTFIARPELGARLMSWSLREQSGHARPIIYWPDDVDFDQFYQVRGGNPILFPFAGRSFYQGKRGYWPDAAGTIRTMPMHGFARQGTFSILAIDDQGFTAELQPTAEDHKAYPYDYRFCVSYTFKERSMTVSMTLENRDTQPVLWSAGHHFYFALPWEADTSRTDYRFNIPAGRCYTHATDGSLQPVEPFDTSDSFGNPQNNDRIFTQLEGDYTHFGLANDNETINVRILQDTDTASQWNAFVIWRESENSPFYCVEPWMGPPNSAEHKLGLHSVMPGERSCFRVEVSLQ